MKIPKPYIPRKARRAISMITVGLMILGFAYIVYSAINIHTDSSSVNHAATTAVLNSATATAFNGTAYTCTLTSTTTASCPQIQLTIGGSGTESGNYTLSLTFTASPAGSQITVNCNATGNDTCSPASQIVFATGTSQSVTGIVVKPTAAGSGTASVTLLG